MWGLVATLSPGLEVGLDTDDRTLDPYHSWRCTLRRRDALAMRLQGNVGAQINWAWKASEMNQIQAGLTSMQPSQYLLHCWSLLLSNHDDLIASSCSQYP
jgi:hypothetical protein